MASTQIRFSTREDYTEAVARGFQLTMLLPTAGGLYTTIQQPSDGGVVKVDGVDTQTFSVRDTAASRVAELVVQGGLAVLKPWRGFTAAERSLGAESFTIDYLGLQHRIVSTSGGTWAVRLSYPAAFSDHDADTGVPVSGSRAAVESAAQPLIDAGVRATIQSHVDSVPESLLEAASLTLTLATKGQYAPREPGAETKLPGEGRELYERAVQLRSDLADFTEGLLDVATQGQ